MERKTTVLRYQATKGRILSREYRKMATKENQQSKTEPLLKAAKTNNAIRTNYIEEKLDNKQRNSKFIKLTQKDYKTDTTAWGRELYKKKNETANHPREWDI